LPDLQALAFDAQPGVRSAVARSLGTLGAPLPAQAISILEHLHNDPETHALADAILQGLPESTGPGEPLATPELHLPFPDRWTVTRQDFLTACIEWHTTLGNAAPDSKNADELLAVQSALSDLIATLSRGQ
jgi:hypothetical protein